MEDNNSQTTEMINPSTPLMGLKEKHNNEPVMPLQKTGQHKEGNRTETVSCVVPTTPWKHDMPQKQT